MTGAARTRSTSPTTAKAVQILSGFSDMELVRGAGASIQDLGIRNPAEEWMKSLTELALKLRMLIFTDDGDIYDEWVTVLEELERSSLARHDPGHLAVALLRVAAITLFVKEAHARQEGRTKPPVAAPARLQRAKSGGTAQGTGQRVSPVARRGNASGEG